MPNRQLENEQLVLEAVASFDGLDYGPSRRDIAQLTGIGLGTVQGIVTRLAEAGKLRYTPGIARSIRIKENT